MIEFVELARRIDAGEQPAVMFHNSDVFGRTHETVRFGRATGAWRNETGCAIRVQLDHPDKGSRVGWRKTVYERDGQMRQLSYAPEPRDPVVSEATSDPAETGDWVQDGAEILLRHFNPSPSGDGSWRLNPIKAIKALHEAGWRSPYQVSVDNDELKILRSENNRLSNVNTQLRLTLSEQRAQVRKLQRLLGDKADGHDCTCTMISPGSLDEPPEWEPDPWCPTHPNMHHILREVGVLKKAFTAVQDVLSNAGLPEEVRKDDESPNPGREEKQS